MNRVTRRPARGYEAALAYIQHVFMPPYDRLLFKLRALPPPPAEADAYTRMLATRNYSDLILHHFFQAADAVQIKRVKTLARRLRRLGGRLDNRAATVGLTTCAKG